MALVACAECGAQISDRAAACPQCGMPRRPAAAAKKQPKAAETAQGCGCLALIALALIAIGIGYMERPTPAPATAKTAAAVAVPKTAETKPDDFADRKTIAAALAPLKRAADWQSVAIDKADGHTYELTLWYATAPAPVAVALDTTRIAQAVLAALVAAGRKPSPEMIWVHVGAMRHVKGATGTDRVAWYGNAHYNPGTDSVTYQPCTGKGWFGC